MLQRRKFSREFKIEAVKLVRERGVSVAQAGRDLVVMRTCCANGKEVGSDPVQALPGHGQMKPEQLEIERLRREVTKLNAERDILKNYPGRSAPVRDRNSRVLSSAAGRVGAVSLLEHCPR